MRSIQFILESLLVIDYLTINVQIYDLELNDIYYWLDQEVICQQMLKHQNQYSFNLRIINIDLFFYLAYYQISILTENSFLMLSSHHSRQNSPEEERGYPPSCFECWTIQKENFFELENRQMRTYGNQSSKHCPNKISIKTSELINSKIRATCATQTPGINQRQTKYSFTSMGLSRANPPSEVKFNSCQQALNAHCFNREMEQAKRNSMFVQNPHSQIPNCLQTTSSTCLRFSQNSNQQMNQPQFFRTKLNFLYSNAENKEQVKKQILIKPQKMVNFGQSIPQIDFSQSNSLQQSQKLYKKRTLKNSQQSKKSNCIKINRLASVNEQMFGKLQFRHTQSIRQPGQDQDHVSIAISSSLLGSSSFERPIKQNEAGHNLSIFGRQVR